MSLLTSIASSNNEISTSFPHGLVAVFVGGTSGVGEYTVKAFAKNAINSRVYIVGRSQESADRIIQECMQVSSGSTFQFIQADVSALRGVDSVCDDIKSKETAINLLFLSQGSMGFNKKSPDGLPLAASLATHSRTRFIANLLPLIQRAETLRRVVSVGAATVEGPVDMSNFFGEGFPLMKWRDQLSSIQTLILEKFSRLAPTVSFIHSLPGIVKGGINRDAEGFSLKLIILVSRYLFEPFLQVPPDECGKRHLFLATSAIFNPAQSSVEAAGVLVPGCEETVIGTDGETGSGAYSMDHYIRPLPAKSIEMLAQLRSNGTQDKIWEFVSNDFNRLTGTGLPETAKSSPGL
ncbi:unnamed protein product [Clonostachys rosea]|uniref:Ketoreductase (KR) domain-containing protein n=1 Tax=Bionectria ochroleuca TaxID=29856 RepID=A0ABY6ULH6_BIOOC|nr:unnamed protein product [Clonostachys rosea]